MEQFIQTLEQLAATASGSYIRSGAVSELLQIYSHKFRGLPSGDAGGLGRRGSCGVDRYVAVGGVAQKSPLVMQMLSDVLEAPISVSASKDSCALGAAIHAAVVAGLYPTVEAAEEALCPPIATTYTPVPSAILRARYRKYLALTGLDEKLA